MGNIKPKNPTIRGSHAALLKYARFTRDLRGKRDHSAACVTQARNLRLTYKTNRLLPR